MNATTTGATALDLSLVRDDVPFRIQRKLRLIPERGNSDPDRLVDACDCAAPGTAGRTGAQIGEDAGLNRGYSFPTFGS